MTENYRLSAADNAPGMPTIVDNATNQSILAVVAGTPVFASSDMAERVLNMLSKRPSMPTEQGGAS